jgi:hypothetical protein
MSENEITKKRVTLIGPYLVVIIAFSNLLVFSDRIASKPTEAGFWMILVFGASLGVALTLTIMQVVSEKKR